MKPFEMNNLVRPLVAHIRSCNRYFPHAPEKHQEEVDEYVMAFEKARTEQGRDYHQIRCKKCDKTIELPDGYDWSAAWELAGTDSQDWQPVSVNDP